MEVMIKKPQLQFFSMMITILWILDKMPYKNMLKLFKMMVQLYFFKM